MDWQPIETAPKDGVHVLVYIPGDIGDDMQDDVWIAWFEDGTWGGDG